MATKAAAMIDSVQNEIGLDAYHIYPTSRRSIPDAVLWGFASACLLEFIKGFVDFKSLGESIRSRLEGLLQHWRDKRDFEEYVRSEGLDKAVYAAVDAIPRTITPTQRSAAIKRLEDALVEVGLQREMAFEHAARIAEVVASSG
jgi:hypothetical protein